MTLVVRKIDDVRQTRSAYLIGCARSGEAVVIDPPRDADACIEVAARDGLRISAVAETQVHADFLSGARELCERTAAQVIASSAGGPECTPRWVTRYQHRLVRDGDTIDIGGIQLRALHTPGAAPEHLTYLIADEGTGILEPIAAVVGSLFTPNVADLTPERIAQLRESLLRIASLPEWTQLLPLRPIRCGAGSLPQTTVGYERVHGTLLGAAHDGDEFADAVTIASRAAAGPCERVRATNLEGVPLLQRLPAPCVLLSLDDHIDLLDPSIATIVDTRAWTVFRSGHLPGAIHAPLGRATAATIAPFIEPDERIVLVCDPSHADELVRECVRVGLDRVEAIIPPALLHSHRAMLRTAPEVSADAAYLALRADDVQVIDVRTAAECVRGVVPGALRISPVQLKAQAPRFHRWKVIVNCSLGTNSATACSVLRRHGVDAVNLAGGIEAWRRAGHPVECGLPLDSETILAAAG